MLTNNAIISLINGAVPERSSEFKGLWEQYNPNVIDNLSRRGVVLEAKKYSIESTERTLKIFWLLGFSGWKAIECYSSLIVYSSMSAMPLNELIEQDSSLAQYERDYKERIEYAKVIGQADEQDIQLNWPADIPFPTDDRESLRDDQNKAAFDLTLSAVGFMFLHEFRHVMLDQDDGRPEKSPDEEMDCDVWARDFMVAKLQKYVIDKGLDYQDVLRRRMMAFSLAALMLYEITPEYTRIGDKFYYPLKDRMLAILDGTNLPDDDSFWIFTAGILVGVYRQRHIPILLPFMSPKLLTLRLISEL